MKRLDITQINEAFNRIGVEKRQIESLSCGSIKEIKEMMKAIFFACDQSINESNFTWFKQYDEVAQWLHNTEGRGLFLTGNCGLGKTLLLKYVVPTILLTTNRKVLKPFHAKDTLHKEKAKEMLSKRFICIDDIGSETFLSDYGQRRQVVADIILSAEEDNKVLILTTNLNSKQMEEKYDIRVLDRLQKICKIINFGDQRSKRFGI